MCFVEQVIDDPQYRKEPLIGLGEYHEHSATGQRSVYTVSCFLFDHILIGLPGGLLQPKHGHDLFLRQICANCIQHQPSGYGRIPLSLTRLPDLRMRNEGVTKG